MWSIAILYNDFPCEKTPCRDVGDISGVALEFGLYVVPIETTISGYSSSILGQMSFHSLSAICIELL